jgi:hypothetical protein
MSKIKFVKNKFGNYVPLKTVTLELSQSQIEVLLYVLLDEPSWNWDDYNRINSSGIPNKVVDPLIDCLKDLEELNELIDKIQSN